VINALERANFEPILASDGNALKLLKKEFPYLKSYELPSYNIQYSKKRNSFKIKLLLSLPFIISAVRKEKRKIKYIIKKEKIEGLISDNRFGAYCKKIPSVYITHQLNVLSGNTTNFTSKIHQKFIQKFNQCWVPDVVDSNNLSGTLGHLKGNKLSFNYIVIVSRFQPQKREIKYDLLVLLSGPEPQRTILENILLTELSTYKGRVLVVRGVLSKQNLIETAENFKIVDYLLSEELEKRINESNVVICRSGYSTIMDLAVLSKKAFFIPTPGQFEQEYLAKRLNVKKIAPYCMQENFSIEKLEQINNYIGFKYSKTTVDLELFKLFDSK
jgi:hypothetical protein